MGNRRNAKAPAPTASLPVHEVAPEAFPELEIHDFPDLSVTNPAPTETVATLSKPRLPENEISEEKEKPMSPSTQEPSELDSHIRNIETMTVPPMESAPVQAAKGNEISPQRLSGASAGPGMEGLNQVVPLAPLGVPHDDVPDTLDLCDLEETRETLRPESPEDTGNIPLASPDEEFQSVAIYPHFGLKKPVEIQKVSTSSLAKPMGDGLELLPDEEELVTRKVPVNFPPVDD
ncbi:MAG: hypothetical protein Q4D98_14635 [Planctomycetia bacterium]|nr:hypothetical protein [Planctomycetia bacterium]